MGISADTSCFTRRHTAGFFAQVQYGQGFRKNLQRNLVAMSPFPGSLFNSFQLSH